MTAVIFPTSLSWIGLKKEAVPGTAETAPNIWVPMMNPVWTPTIKVILNEALYGDMAKVHGASAGSRYDMMAYDTYPFNDTLFQHNAAILGGGDTVTGSADPVTHKTSLLNTNPGQPPTYTVFIFNGAECWQMAGSVLGKLDIDLSPDNLGKVSAEWTGLAAVKMGSPPSNTPSTATPWSGTNTVVTVGGVTASTYTAVKIAISRDVEPVITATGTTTPYAIFAGGLNVDYDVSGVYVGYTGSELEKLITNVHPALTVKCYASGDSSHYGLWTSTLTVPSKASPKQEMGKYVSIDSTFTAISNTTDALAGAGAGTSPLSFTLINTATTPLA